MDIIVFVYSYPVGFRFQVLRWAGQMVVLLLRGRCVVRDILVPCFLFPFSRQKKYHNNSNNRPCSNMRMRGYAALAARLADGDPLDISGQRPFRNYFCLVGFSALCSRLCRRGGMAEAALE